MFPSATCTICLVVNHNWTCKSLLNILKIQYLKASSVPWCRCSIVYDNESLSILKSILNWEQKFVVNIIYLFVSKKNYSLETKYIFVFLESLCVFSCKFLWNFCFVPFQRVVIKMKIGSSFFLTVTDSKNLYSRVRLDSMQGATNQKDSFIQQGTVCLCGQHASRIWNSLNLL